MSDSDESKNAETSTGTVLFTRSDDEGHDSDVWDDTALIKAYDRAVNLAYDAVLGSDVKRTSRAGNTKANGQLHASEVSGGTGRKQKWRRNKKQSSKQATMLWNVGDHCLAPYSEDGELYEAQIESIDQSTQFCEVVYPDYGNRESQPLSALIPIDANSSRDSSVSIHPASQPDAIFSQDHSALPRGFAIPPPPPPQANLLGLPSESEALSSMLMAWYMSGYHTGYYQAYRDFVSKGESNTEN